MFNLNQFYQLTVQIQLYNYHYRSFGGMWTRDKVFDYYPERICVLHNCNVYRIHLLSHILQLLRAPFLSDKLPKSREVQIKVHWRLDISLSVNSHCVTSTSEGKISLIESKMRKNSLFSQIHNHHHHFSTTNVVSCVTRMFASHHRPRINKHNERRVPRVFLEVTDHKNHTQFNFFSLKKYSFFIIFFIIWVFLFVCYRATKFF